MSKDKMARIPELFEKAGHETQKGNFERALKLYTEIIALSTQVDRARHLAHWGIGDIYLNRKQYEKAEYHLSQAVSLAPDQSIYHYLLGCTYTYLDKIDKAIHHVKQAIELDDSKDVYWGQLGWVIGHNSDVDKGIEYLKKSLSLNPGNTRSLQDICILYVKKKKFNEAMVCIEEAEKYDPDNEEIRRLKEELEFFKSQFDKI